MLCGLGSVLESVLVALYLVSKVSEKSGIEKQENSITYIVIQASSHIKCSL